MVRATGDWTLRALCLVLAVTPLRVMTGLAALARLVDKFLGLCARRAVGLSPNDPVNTLAVDHDVDAEYAVAVGLTLEGDAVLVELVASSKLAHGRAGEFGEGFGHGGFLV